jgi:hypothetical protein
MGNRIFDWRSIWGQETPCGGQERVNFSAASGESKGFQVWIPGAPIKIVYCLYERGKTYLNGFKLSAGMFHLNKAEGLMLVL